MAMTKERQYGKGGRGTKKWGEMISEAVNEAQQMRKQLERLGYRFESWSEGLIAYRVTMPNGAIINRPIGFSGLKELIEKEG